LRLIFFIPASPKSPPKEGTLTTLQYGILLSISLIFVSLFFFIPPLEVRRPASPKSPPKEGTLIPLQYGILLSISLIFVSLFFLHSSFGG